MNKTKKRTGGTTSAKPRFLCEGWLDEGCEGNPVFIPERAVCIQGDKAWIAYGASSQLDESFPGVTLVESYDELELEERQINGTTVKLPKGGRWVVEGPAQRSDVKNANKRVYSRSIWEKLIANKDSYVQEAISERRMVGHLEHPKDGRTDLNEAAILVTEATLRKDGVVWGKFELLETPKGLILQELTRKGVKWGVSSRGTGTVGDDGNVSEDDYHLKTWDAVASPSTPGAHPTLSASEDTDENTSDDSPQAELSEDHEETLTRLIELSETEPDDLAGRVALRDDILTALLTLDENALQAILLRDQGWAQIAKAIEKAREGSAGDDIDAAIDEALASGEEAEDESAFVEIIEALQEQVSASVDEVSGLNERLEAAESERDALTERLAEAEGELAQLRVERDLAHELLAETPGRNAGDVAAAADEAIEEVPELERFRDLMESAESPEQVRSLAERLAPVVKKPEAKAPVEETTKPKQPARTSLPAGIGLDSTDYTPSKAKPQISESSGARLVGAMTGFRKNS